MPLIENNYKVEGLKNTALTASKIDLAPCSQDCCKWAQWPTSFKTSVGDIPENELSFTNPNELSISN
jgi:hypothetical protein